MLQAADAALTEGHLGRLAERWVTAYHVQFKELVNDLKILSAIKMDDYSRLLADMDIHESCPYDRPPCKRLACEEHHPDIYLATLYDQKMECDEIADYCKRHKTKHGRATRKVHGLRLCRTCVLLRKIHDIPIPVQQWCVCDRLVAGYFCPDCNMVKRH